MLTLRRIMISLALAIPLLWGVGAKSVSTSENESKKSDAIKIVIIADSGIAEKQLSHEDIKNIWLGKKTRWRNGDKIHFATLTSGKVHEYFLNHYVGKTPRQYELYWKRKIFTGKGSPPPSFKTEDELAHYVSSVPGAIGYISPNTKTNKKVKNIAIENQSGGH